MNRKLQFALRIAVSLALLAYIVNKITPKAVIEAIGAADLRYIPAIVLLFIISLIIKAANYSLLTRPLTKISFTRLMKISVLTWVAGMFAPGKVGELSIIYFLNKQGIPLGAATAISVLDKLITISVLTVTAAIGLLMFLDKTQAIRIIALLAAGLAAVVLLIASSKARQLIRKIILRKHESKFAGFSRYLVYYAKKHKMLVIFNFLLAIIWLYVSAAMLWLGLLSVGMKVPIISIFLVNSASLIVSIIPITMGGLGARETVAVLLFEKAGMPAAGILAGYLVITIVSNALALAASLYAVLKKKELA